MDEANDTQTSMSQIHSINNIHEEGETCFNDEILERKHFEDNIKNLNETGKNYEDIIKMDVPINCEYDNETSETNAVAKISNSNFEKNMYHIDNTAEDLSVTKTDLSKICIYLDENNVCFDLNCRNHDVMAMELSNDHFEYAAKTHLNDNSKYYVTSKINFNSNGRILEELDIIKARNVVKDKTKVECFEDEINTQVLHPNVESLCTFKDDENVDMVSNKENNEENYEEIILDLDEFYEEFFNECANEDQNLTDFVGLDPLYDNDNNLNEFKAIEAMSSTLQITKSEINNDAVQNEYVTEFEYYLNRYCKAGNATSTGNNHSTDLNLNETVDYEDLLTPHQINMIKDANNNEIACNNVKNITNEDFIDETSSPAPNFKDTVKGDLKTLPIIIIEDSDDDGYNSSDFEFITESEAKKAGILYKNQPDNDKSNATVKPADDNVDSTIKEESNKEYFQNINMQQQQSSVVKDREYYRKLRAQYLMGESKRMRGTHVIPQGEDYFSLFLGGAQTDAGFRENKSVTFPICMNVDRTADWSYIQESPENIPYREESIESAQKIREMYPEENTCKRRSLRRSHRT